MLYETVTNTFNSLHSTVKKYSFFSFAVLAAVFSDFHSSFSSTRVVFLLVSIFFPRLILGMGNETLYLWSRFVNFVCHSNHRISNVIVEMFTNTNTSIKVSLVCVCVACCIKCCRRYAYGVFQLI